MLLAASSTRRCGACRRLLPEPAREPEEAIERFVPDPRRYEAAVDQELRRRDQCVRLARGPVDPLPQPVDVRGRLQLAEPLARRGEHLDPADPGEREKRVPGDRTPVGREKRDLHLTAPSMMPRFKPRWRSVRRPQSRLRKQMWSQGMPPTPPSPTFLQPTPPMSMRLDHTNSL